MSRNPKSMFYCLFFISFILCSLISPGLAKSKRRENSKKVAQSHNFFNFDETSYFTSPDKRIGVKFLIDPTKVGPSFVALQHLTLLPKSHTKSHRHVYVTEVIYILKGNLTLRIEKEIKVMGPNTTGYIPPQTFHEYLNDGPDVCEFLQYYSPSGPEEEYRNWAKPGEGETATSTSVSLPLVVKPDVPQTAEKVNSSERSFETSVASDGMQLKLKKEKNGQPSFPTPIQKLPLIPSNGKEKREFEVEIQ